MLSCTGVDKRMDSCNGCVERLNEDIRLIAAGGVERARHTSCEHFQKGRLFKLSACLVAAPVRRLFVTKFTKLQGGAFC